MPTATVSRPFGDTPDSASSCQFGGMLTVHVFQSSNKWLLSSYTFTVTIYSWDEIAEAPSSTHGLASPEYATTLCLAILTVIGDSSGV